MNFGSWEVTEDKIFWSGDALRLFEIPMSHLNAIRPGFANGSNHYDWILVATDEEWLTQDDLYDLNYAFVYAVAKSGLDFNYEIFEATLELQFDLFEEEYDEEEE